MALNTLTLTLIPIFVMLTFSQYLWLCLYIYDSSQQLTKQDNENEKALLYNPLNYYKIVPLKKQKQI